MLSKEVKKKETRLDGQLREVRRGELEGIKSKYGKIANFDELVMLCAALDAGRIKKREIDELYRRGKIETNTSCVVSYVYGRPHHADKSTFSIPPKAYLTLTAEAYFR